MTLHLIKLCVGIESAEHLQERVALRQSQAAAAGQDFYYCHTTRMAPKRKDELLNGGSLYWVIKGQVRARQRFTDIKPFIDDEGISRCDLVLDPELVFTSWQPRRAFQGWRYLKVDDAPPDLNMGEEGDTMPLKFRQELADLGLL